MRAIVGRADRQVAARSPCSASRPGRRRCAARIGYLTQAPSVYADLTVRENARYFASLYGLGAAEADAAVADVGLADAAGQLVGTLSGGQRSRASLACALVGEPELLVLDEPTVGQDPVLRDELWARFRALAAAGTTLLVSSHVMDEASRCDRLLLIREGELIADDTPAAVTAAAGTDDLDEAFLRLIRAPRRRRRPVAIDEPRGSWPPPTGRILRQLRHDRRTIAMLWSCRACC